MCNYIDCNDPLIGKEEAIKYLSISPELYDIYFTRFVKRYINSCEIISTLIKDNSYDEAFRYVHSIKGTSRTLGLLPLGDAAESLENDLSSEENTGHNTANINKSLTIFQSKMQELLVLIRT